MSTVDQRCARRIPLHAITTASALAATIATAFLANISSATTPESSGGDRIAALCHEVGTAEQCTCYSARMRSQLSPAGHAVLASDLAIQVKYMKLEKQELHRYVTAHPSAGNVDVSAEALRIGLLAGARRHQEQDALAARTPGDLYSAVSQADQEAWGYCHVGKKGVAPPPGPYEYTAPKPQTAAEMDVSLGASEFALDDKRERHPVTDFNVVADMRIGDRVEASGPIHGSPATGTAIAHIRGGAPATIIAMQGDYLKLEFRVNSDGKQYPPGWVRKDFVSIDFDAHSRTRR